jgi:hypothetical protein
MLDLLSGLVFELTDAQVRLHVASLHDLLALIALNTMFPRTFEAKMLLQNLLHISDATFYRENVACRTHKFDLPLTCRLMSLGLIKCEDGLASFVGTLKFSFV